MSPIGNRLFDPRVRLHKNCQFLCSWIGRIENIDFRRAVSPGHLSYRQSDRVCIFLCSFWRRLIRGSRARKKCIPTRVRIWHIHHIPGCIFTAMHTPLLTVLLLSCYSASLLLGYVQPSAKLVPESLIGLSVLVLSLIHI